MNKEGHADSDADRGVEEGCNSGLSPDYRGKEKERLQGCPKLHTSVLNIYSVHRGFTLRSMQKCSVLFAELNWSKN